MTKKPNIGKALAPFHPDLVAEINSSALQKELPKDQEILTEGQYVKRIPFVLDGLIKVSTRHEDKELLLYYIKPNERCIMSFAAGLKNEPSKVCATTEEETSVLLLPVDKVSSWTKQFPDINNLFFQQYNLRYGELLDTIHQVLFERMDKRLHTYLKEKIEVTSKNPLKISHRQIAKELGTAREVISRTMKKLEAENRVKQHPGRIEIL